MWHSLVFSLIVQKRQFVKIYWHRLFLRLRCGCCGVIKVSFATLRAKSRSKAQRKIRKQNENANRSRLSFQRVSPKGARSRLWQNNIIWAARRTRAPTPNLTLSFVYVCAALYARSGIDKKDATERRKLNARPGVYGYPRKVSVFVRMRAKRRGAKAAIVMTRWRDTHMHA